MKRIILMALLFFFFYFLPEMVGGIRIEKADFGFAFLLTLFAMLVIDWCGIVSSGRIDWGKKSPTHKNK